MDGEKKPCITLRKLLTKPQVNGVASDKVSFWVGQPISTCTSRTGMLVTMCISRYVITVFMNNIMNTKVNQ